MNLRCKRHGIGREDPRDIPRRQSEISGDGLGCREETTDTDDIESGSEREYGEQDVLSHRRKSRKHIFDLVTFGKGRVTAGLLDDGRDAFGALIEIERRRGVACR